ncbi:hypothetical protein ABZ656_25600, partial [Streptomyces sp. NPDC007095]
MAYRTPGPLRTVGAVGRALLGLALLVALLVGTPYVLLLVGTQPTDLSGGIDVLLRPDDGTLFFTAITCIGWVAWAAFTFSVALEVVAVARRRSAPRLRGLGGLQSMASFLVGGIVLLAPTAASAATSAPAHAVTATQTASTSTSTASATSSPSPSAESTNGPTHTVSSSTELPWDLAEKYLGSGQRWQDIAALNPDTPGLAAGDQYLPKGAVITLPSDAVPATPSVSPDSTQAGGDRTQLNRSAPDADGERGATVTVQPGDYLSEIAQKELGDGAEWPKLFEASQGKPQPHGLPEITNPDVIYPGQQVTVPGAQGERHEKPAQGESAGTSSTPPSTKAPRSGHKPGADHTDTQVPAPSQSTAPAPQTSAPSTPSSRPTHQPGQEHGAGPAAPRPSASAPESATAEPSASDAPSPTATAPQEPASSPASGTLQLRTVLGAGALLAAAVTGALALRRLLQRRRRKPGEKIAITSEISPAEAEGPRVPQDDERPEDPVHRLPEQL